MGYKDLTSAEMIAISGDWISADTEAGKLFRATKQLDSVYQFITAAHEGLGASQVVGDSTVERELQALAEKNAELDARHDKLVRCIWKTLNALAEGAKTKARATLYLDTAKAIFPDGASSTQATYAGQAGNAALVEQRLKPEHKEMLAAITTPDGTLAQHVSRWKKRALELGESDKERARLVAQKDAGVTRADAQVARTEWVRAADLLVRTLRMAKLTPAELETLTGPLTKAVERATKRGKGGGEEDPEDGEGGPEGAGV
jgi:hypothetical protein